MIITYELQFQRNPFLLARFAGLGKLGCLQGGRLEKGVAFAAASALEQHDFLLVLSDFSHLRVVLGVKSHRAKRHVDINIVASCARELVFASRNAVAGIDMFGITQMEQSPELGIAAHDDVAAATAVAAVGTAFRDVFLATEVQRTRTALAGTAEYLYVINEIRGHFS